MARVTTQPPGAWQQPPRQPDAPLQRAPAGAPAAELRPHEPARRGSPERRFSIPSGYGDDRIVLMVKDPWWLYAYWEIQPGTERAARSQLLPQEVAGLQSVLRVYDVTDVEFPAQPAQQTFDIALSGMAANWYIQTNAPGRSFIVDIGLLTRAGRFLRLARSNRVVAPRFGPSDVIDEAWMTTDEAYWKLFGASAGIGIGASPMGGWASLVPQQLFSGSRASASLFGVNRQSVVRGFWCRVNTDLVIHGATEPKSTVTIQGQPVTVRKDGTFSLRVALPPGTQTITIDVVSSDGRHTQTVTPVVTLAWAGELTPEITKTKTQVAQQRPESHERRAGEAA